MLTYPYSSNSHVVATIMTTPVSNMAVHVAILDVIVTMYDALFINNYIAMHVFE